MPLTEADIARIEEHGFQRAHFSDLDDENVPQLRNTGEHCVFLNDKGLCGIYEFRPEGCRLYPLVWDRDAGRVVRDDFCPFNQEFTITPQQEAAVKRVLSVLEREARDRTAHGTA